MGSSMARVTFRNSRGIKMSVELIRKYNISPRAGLVTRILLSTQFLRRRNSKFEVIIQTRGEKGSNLKIFGQRADPSRFNFPFLDRLYRDSKHSVREIRSDLHKIRTEKNGEKNSNGWNTMIQVKWMFHRTNVVG